MGCLNQSKGMTYISTQKIVRLAELAEHLECSKQTAQRRLADWQAIRSYNQNGGCYTLPSIAIFDANGLWRHDGACFSCFGNLSETFVHLVAASPAGLTAAELDSLLGMRTYSFLGSFREHPAFKRKKHQGRFVYYSSEDVVYKKQRKQRELMDEKARSLMDFEAVAVLVEKIKCPDLSNEELSERLKKQELSVAPEMIGNLFAKHDLCVKKTLHSV